MLAYELFSFNKILKLKLIDTKQLKNNFKDKIINFILPYKLDISFQIKMAVIFWHDIISTEIKTIIFQYQQSAILVHHMHMNK